MIYDKFSDFLKSVGSAEIKSLKSLIKEKEIEKKKPIESLVQIEFENGYFFYVLISLLSLKIGKKKSLIDEVLLDFHKDSNSLDLQMLDASRVCLMYVRIEDLKYVKYDCKIGYNINDLGILLKVNKTDPLKSLKIQIDPKSFDLKIIKEDYENGSITTKILRNLEIEREEIPLENVLKIDYTNKFKIKPIILKEIMKELKLFSEIITIVTEKHNVVFSSVGQIGDASYLVPEDALNHYVYRDNVAKGSYSLLYLKPFFATDTDITKISTEPISFYSKEDHPLRIDVPLKFFNCTIYFLLAPRVEEVEFEEEW